MRRGFHDKIQGRVRALLMMLESTLKVTQTNDAVIREALKKRLLSDYKGKFRIVEEMGIKHGAARIDLAVVNGILHGYEIKSDKDTLFRLREQMETYNSVFDQVTIVVGKTHLYEAINTIPDWWGIEIAKIDQEGNVAFHTIRGAQDNQKQVDFSIAQLLWRGEALQILENHNKAEGFRSKPRSLIYQRLTDVLDSVTLRKEVRNVLLLSRKTWRSDLSLA